MKTRGSPANLAVQLVSQDDQNLEVKLLENFGTLNSGTVCQATWRPSKLDRNDDESAAIPRLEEGALLDLLNTRLLEEGDLSYKSAELFGNAEEIEDGSLEMRTSALVSIRHSIAMQEGGKRPEVYAVRREDSIPIKQIMSGLDDMLGILKSEDGYGLSGFLLRGKDPRGTRQYSAMCVLTTKQMERGVSAEDVLGEFLRSEVPGLSKMVREAFRKKNPWMIVPVDVLTTTQDFAYKASQQARSIPFHEVINGEDTWFAESLLVLDREDDAWQVSYLSPRRDFPMLVGRDFPEGPIEPPVDVWKEEPGIGLPRADFFTRAASPAS